jgi:uncharacterized membrane protein YfhO
VGRSIGGRGVNPDGSLSATAVMRHAGVVVLSASYDPGWRAFVDGRPVATEMVAPALVAVQVPSGRHRVNFVYRGYRGYPLLFALGAMAFAVLLVPDCRRWHRTRRHRVSHDAKPAG